MSEKKEETKDTHMTEGNSEEEMPEAEVLAKEGLPVKEVTVHPLVLLSVVDHYNRMARNTSKRVVGVLLGEVFRGKVDVTNSFASECRGQSPAILPP